MNKTEPQWVAIQHDCERDTHDYRMYGPFDTEQAGLDFVERHQLWMPLDGGYAFASVLCLVIPPNMPKDELIDPVQWEEGREEWDDDEAPAG